MFNNPNFDDLSRSLQGMMTSHDDWYWEFNVLTLDGENFTGQSYIHSENKP